MQRDIKFGKPPTYDYSEKLQSGDIDWSKRRLVNRHCSQLSFLSGFDLSQTDATSWVAFRYCMKRAGWRIVNFAGTPWALAINELQPSRKQIEIVREMVTRHSSVLVLRVTVVLPLIQLPDMSSLDSDQHEIRAVPRKLLAQHQMNRSYDPNRIKLMFW